MLWTPPKRILLTNQRPHVRLHDLREDAADLTTYTFTNVNIGDLGTTSSTNPSSSSDVAGTLNPNVRSRGKRGLFIIVHAEDDAITFGITSVTVGGVSMQEQIDRGGATNAINTGLYAIGTANLRDMVGSDVVVVFNEAVTACAIAAVMVENFGQWELISSPVATGTSEITLTPSANAENLDRFEHALFASTLAATGQTCTWRSHPESGGVSPMLLYDEANAEMSYSAAWTYSPGYNGGNVTSCGVMCDWSGATAFDVVGTSFR